jgi:hypothetical protein
MRHYIGIDPGKKGACVVLDDKGIIVDMHFLKIDSEGYPDYDDLNIYLHNWNMYAKGAGLEMVVIAEEPLRQAGGKTNINSLASGFRWEMSIVIACGRHGIARRFVPANTWKAHHGVRAKKGEHRKARSNAFAVEKWPEFKCHVTSKGNKSENIHDGLADAALIALWGLENEI